ncbi:MAG: FKBP-type peptidyl-prolyl cis-trans isomerase [Chitinophagales bacterium]|nr:FKBP-type peptidyl-prolyl cis-trans isomerase [Chitinophagales bacterium]
MKKIVLGVFTLAFASMALFSCNDKCTDHYSGTAENLSDSLGYALGVNIGENLKKSGFEEINEQAMAQAIKDIYAGTASMNSADAESFINNYMMQLSEKKAAEAAGEGLAFLEENGKRDGVITTASGLQYEVLTEGSGASPSATDVVTVHYHGTLIDGTIFDSSVDRGEPASFPLNGVIAGWTEGLQLMKEGGKTRFYIPSNLAYGERGAGQTIGPGATLIFDVELLKVGE